MTIIIPIFNLLKNVASEIEKKLYSFTYLKGRVKGRKGKVESEQDPPILWFILQITSQQPALGQPEARSLSRSPHIGNRDPSDWAADFTGTLTRSYIGNGTARLKPEPICNAENARGSLIYYTTMQGPNKFSKNLDY